MSTGSYWPLDPDCTKTALAAWLERDQPDDTTRERVHESLMDLAQAPLNWGTEDRDQPGIYWGRVPTTNVGITYALNVDEHKVCLAIIIPL